jgi:hypothetical protein
MVSLCVFVRRFTTAFGLVVFMHGQRRLRAVLAQQRTEQRVLATIPASTAASACLR